MSSSISRHAWIAVAALLPASPAAGGELKDLYFGEALYHAYQEHYFEALERLDVEIAQHHGVDERQLETVSPVLRPRRACARAGQEHGDLVAAVVDRDRPRRAAVGRGRQERGGQDSGGEGEGAVPGIHLRRATGPGTLRAAHALVAFLTSAAVAPQARHAGLEPR